MKQEASFDRIQWVDYLKAICILAVILNHHYGPQIYGLLTYPFELVGFFFAAGYTFNKKISFKEFILRKTRTLLIPIFIFGIVNSILGILAKQNTTIQDRIIGIICQVPGHWDDLWFLACLFTMELIYYPVSRIPSKNNQHICVLILFLLGCIYTSIVSERIPWHVENALLLMPYLHIGATLKDNKTLNSWMKSVVDYKKMALYIVASGICYIASVIIFKNYPIDIHILDYGNAIGFAANATFGLCFVVLCCIYLEKFKFCPCLATLSFIGMNTLVFYAFQSKAISIIGIVISKVGISAPSAITTLISCSFVVVILSCISHIIRHLCPWVIGQKQITR